MSWQTGQGDCDPEDIFQDTIVRCFATVHAMRAETERGFRAWFLGVARNRLLERARRRSRGNIGKSAKSGGLHAGSSVSPGPTNNPGPHLGSRNGPELLWNLKTQNRSALLLRELFSLPWNDVATVLTRPSGTAARGLHARTRRRASSPRGSFCSVRSESQHAWSV
jgi:DNA-directed RNA polymerase specialized sigma24 family protein